MLKKLLKLFNKDLPKGKTYHMQDHQAWGNNIEWCNWPELRIRGWLNSKPLVGDIITCDFESGKKLEFQIINVKYSTSVRDLFFANVKYLSDLTKG